MSPSSATSGSDQAPKAESFDYEGIPTGYYDAVFHRRKGIQSKWHHMKFAPFRALLAGYKKHLDIGCGPGTFIGTLGPEHDSTGVDLASQQIAFARENYAAPNRRFERVDRGALPFDDGAFDVVSAIELLEHIEDGPAEELIREAVRVLRPGGRLVMSTPNYGGPWPLVEFLLNRLGDVSYEDQHINHFDRPRLTALLKDCGLGGVSVRGHLFAAPFTAPLGWTVPDAVARLEPDFLVARFGMLLIGTGTKAS